MRAPRRHNRNTSRNVVSMRDWRKTTRQRTGSRPPLQSWHAWGLVLLVAAGVTLYDNVDTGGSSATDSTFTCTVASVTDGDTLRCSNGTRVRLSAIAARESDGTCRPGHPCPAASAASAKKALERMALGQTLTCEVNGKSYDRVTAWCSDSAGIQLNCAMVEGGYAERWEKYDPAGRLCG